LRDYVDTLIRGHPAREQLLATITLIICLGDAMYRPGQASSELRAMHGIAPTIGNQSKTRKGIDMMHDTSPALAAAESIVARWRDELGPDIQVVLGGSLCSGLFIWDQSTNAIDVDVKFLVDERLVLVGDTHERIERVTGLTLRKQITVRNEPDESPSVGLLFEGRFDVPGIAIPLEVEGCLRNQRYVSSARLYPLVFSQTEMHEIRRTKAQLKGSGNMLAYKKYKSWIRQEADARIAAQGYVVVSSECSIPPSAQFAQQQLARR
jgi:hypothetical protein